MACGALTQVATRNLEATPGAAAYAWFTGWILCTGLDKFVATLKNLTVDGSFRSQVVAQFASVRSDAPETPIAYGVAQAGAGARVVESGDIKSTSSTKYLVRFGAKYDVSSGANPASAEVELQVAYDMCGRAVGTFDEQLMVTSDTKVYYALTPWLPSLHAAKMKAAMLVNGLGGNFKWRMTYRTAEVYPANADAWQADWDPTNNPERGSGELNTGELAPATAGKMWVQFGIMVYLSSGYTTPGQASVQASVAVRK